MASENKIQSINPGERLKVNQLEKLRRYETNLDRKFEHK